jgi:hypothetical protein
MNIHNQQRTKTDTSNRLEDIGFEELVSGTYDDGLSANRNKTSVDSSYSSNNNISPTTSDLISQVGSSCQYSGRCTYCQHTKASNHDIERCGEKLSGKSYSSGEPCINHADTYSPNIPVGVTLQGEDDGSRKTSLDTSYSCSYVSRCANSSDKCRDIAYRESCTCMDDFVFGWHGVGF